MDMTQLLCSSKIPSRKNEGLHEKRAKQISQSARYDIGNNGKGLVRTIENVKQKLLQTHQGKQQACIDFTA
jgi:hypothetical protein